MDIGSAVGRQQGLVSDDEIAAVADFEHSALFNDAERAAMRLADAMCERTVDIPEAVYDDVRKHFTEPQLVELVAMIGLENMRARFNRVFQIESDNLCALPQHHPALKAAASS